MWSRKERKIWTDCKQGLHCSCQRRVPKKEELVFVVRKTAKGIGKKGKNKRKRGNLGGKRKDQRRRKRGIVLRKIQKIVQFGVAI